MSKPEFPMTTGVRFLRQKQIEFTPHLYAYEEHGGTARAAEMLGVPEHAVVKTLVFESETRKPFLVLMHGDQEVSGRQLARTLGVKHVVPSDPATAQRVTGYMVGGISPFGTKNELHVYVEQSIFDLSLIYINGGKRGFLVSINPRSLREAFSCVAVSAAAASGAEPL